MHKVASLLANIGISSRGCHLKLREKRLPDSHCQVGQPVNGFSIDVQDATLHAIVIEMSLNSVFHINYTKSKLRQVV